MKTIEITIDAKGEVVVQTKGFAGSACKEASRFIEQALGAVQSDIATAEMHQSAPAAQPIQQNNG